MLMWSMPFETETGGVRDCSAVESDDNGMQREEGMAGPSIHHGGRLAHTAPSTEHTSPTHVLKRSHTQDHLHRTTQHNPIPGTAG